MPQLTPSEFAIVMKVLVLFAVWHILKHACDILSTRIKDKLVKPILSDVTYITSVECDQRRATCNVFSAIEHDMSNVILALRTLINHIDIEPKEKDYVMMQLERRRQQHAATDSK